jgi:hypothetical protein
VQTIAHETYRPKYCYEIIRIFINYEPALFYNRQCTNVINTGSDFTAIQARTRLYFKRKPGDYRRNDLRSCRFKLLFRRKYKQKIATLYLTTQIDTENNHVSKLNLDNFIIAGNDGLYFYENSLIGIQNVLFPISVNRFYLDLEQKKLIRGEVLSAGDTALVVPTTGVIVGDEFYFMSNNNIGTEDPSSPTKADMKKVKPVRVAKILLTNKM